MSAADLWVYNPKRDMFFRGEGARERIHRHNLPCTEGDLIAGIMGSKHTYESWGLDVKSFGAVGFWECEIFVCSNPQCMRTKQGKKIRPN